MPPPTSGILDRGGALSNCRARHAHGAAVLANSEVLAVSRSGIATSGRGRDPRDIDDNGDEPPLLLLPAMADSTPYSWSAAPAQSAEVGNEHDDIATVAVSCSARHGALLHCSFSIVPFSVTASISSWTSDSASATFTVSPSAGCVARNMRRLPACVTR